LRSGPIEIYYYYYFIIYDDNSIYAGKTCQV